MYKGMGGGGRGGEGSSGQKGYGQDFTFAHKMGVVLKDWGVVNAVLLKLLKKGNLKRNTDIANMSIEGAPLPSARCPWVDCGHWKGTPLCLMPLSR
jgi:hypothetical protein